MAKISPSELESPHGAQDVCLHLKAPDNCKLFTNDKGEIQKINTHFLHIIGNVREECDKLGVNITRSASFTGEIHVNGTPEKIGQIREFMAKNNWLLGK